MGEKKERRQKTGLIEDYCVDCDYRKDSYQELADTNKIPFCWVGYTQNPRTKEATVNVINNKGKVCSNNPYIKNIRRNQDGVARN